jgi:hypothetical protein
LLGLILMILAFLWYNPDFYTKPIKNKPQSLDM